MPGHHGKETVRLAGTAACVWSEKPVAFYMRAGVCCSTNSGRTLLGSSEHMVLHCSWVERKTTSLSWTLNRFSRRPKPD